VKSGACWHSGRRYGVPHNVENSRGGEKKRVPSEHASRCDVSLQVPTTPRRGQVFIDNPSSAGTRVQHTAVPDVDSDMVDLPPGAGEQQQIARLECADIEWKSCPRMGL
jgi:hypothetical protein